MYVLVWVVFLGSSGATMYEVPTKTYIGEQLLDILLNPEIDATKICHERPMQIK